MEIGWHNGGWCVKGIDERNNKEIEVNWYHGELELEPDKEINIEKLIDSNMKNRKRVW